MRADPRVPAAVFCGGVAGTLARALVADALPHEPGTWPWGTFLVNVAGAFVLGLVVLRGQARPAADRYRRPLLATGFCGALTTFSALQLELLAMLDEARVGLAVAYAATSVAAGLAGMLAALGLIRRAGAAA